MKIAFLYGEGCERFIQNFSFPKYCRVCGPLCDFCKNYDYSKNVVYAGKVPGSLEGLEVDFDVPKFECDVLIAINVHPDVLLDVFDFAEFKALIVPVEDHRWLRPGLKLQVNKRCEDLGIDFEAPKPFCSLKGKGLIKKFCEEFRIGFPEFEVHLEDRCIRKVKVLKSDPCGSSYYVAKMMSGFVFKDEQSLYSEVHKHQCSYPCTASMERDPELSEAPLHLAGYIMAYSFAKACGIDARSFVPKKFWKFLE